MGPSGIGRNGCRCHLSRMVGLEVELNVEIVTVFSLIALIAFSMRRVTLWAFHADALTPPVRQLADHLIAGEFSVRCALHHIGAEAMAGSKALEGRTVVPVVFDDSAAEI